MTIHELQSGWLFTKTDSDQFDSSHAEAVLIPHTWNAYDGQDGGNDYYRGRCWYKLQLDLPIDPARYYYLEIDGANSITNVYVNKHQMGEHRGGYSAFRFDITDALQTSDVNEILVSVDNGHYEDVFPLVADFTFMGGLYRSVRLIEVGNLHIDLDDHGSPGMSFTAKSIDVNRANCEVVIQLVNHEEAAADAIIRTRLIATGDGADDSNGNDVVATGECSISVRDKLTESITLKIDAPHLWNGIADPFLHTLETEISVDNVVVDQRSMAVGLRTVDIDPEKGFILNGNRLRLNGVSRHQDRKDVGWALSDAHQDEDLSIIRSMGANSIRLAHYQHNQYFFDICDRAGIVVWAEIPYITTPSPEDLTGSNALSQLTELIKQNYNHPSIAFWGVQNEITIAGKQDNVEEIVGELNTLAKFLDPSRITVQAHVGHHPDDDSMNTITDAVGYNKYYGWYYDEVEDFDPWLTRFHKALPEIPIGITEYGCEAILSYHTDEPKRNDYTEEYQALYHEKVLKIFDARPYIWGTYVWNMFDFASDMRDEGGVKGMNNKGLVTHDRRIKKDSFYWYQANWTTEPMVHINGKRYQNRPTKKIQIKVFTNQPSVTLFVSGVEIQSQAAVDHVARFVDVELVDGKTEVAVTAGTARDEAVFLAVDVPDPSYEFSGRHESPLGAANWFDDFTEEESGPLEFPDGYFSIKDRISTILKSSEGEKVLRELMGPMFEHPMFGMLKGFSIEKLSEMRSEMFPAAFLAKLNRELNRVRKS